ncbi:MAG: peptidoglycan-associated lipoprotein [Alphaproteobacteria bacterium HGW-Alphaproteobacteria-2]|nr:MAG: peptidoglycan-associated lipoprotein [Alphaproteobacteria bacterium HGW-Alphaproteobacteria-2]
MRITSTGILLVAALGLAACSGGFRADGDGAGAGAGGGGIGAGSFAPNSPEYFAQTVGDRVFFAVDESTLSSEARITLDAQAAWLQQNAEFSILIEGHADERGTREYNLALGARRASAVRDYLASRGIPDRRLRTVSYGKERPVELCSAESCWGQNRRAVSVLSTGGTS